MQKHFFTFRKIVDGQPAPIYIEVIVAGPFSRTEARAIAEAEVDELREGARALRREITRVESTVRSLPDYRFVGVN